MGNNQPKFSHTCPWFLAERKPSGIQKADFPVDASCVPLGMGSPGRHSGLGPVEGEAKSRCFSGSLHPGAGAAGSGGDKVAGAARSGTPS